MGNVPSTVSKSQATAIQANKLATIEKMKSNTMNNINQLQTHVIHNMSSSSNTNTSIISNNDNMEKILAASFTATKQMARGGKQLTKDDLISILLFIQTVQSGKNCFNTIENYKILNCDDIINVIRTIIYDPTAVKKAITVSCSAAVAQQTQPSIGNKNTNNAIVRYNA
jgi:hypothetical protein